MIDASMAITKKRAIPGSPALKAKKSLYSLNPTGG